MYRILSRNFFWVWLALGSVSGWAAHIPAPRPEILNVALLAPYSVESVTIKTGGARVHIRLAAGGYKMWSLAAGQEFQLTAQNNWVRLDGWPGLGSADLAEGVRVELMEPEREEMEITARSLAPQKFKGPIRVQGRRDRLLLIEEVRLEDYLAGVVLAEAEEGRHGEALQAQAIVSRTFAWQSARRHAAEGYDLCSATHCQVYRGAVDRRHPAAAAVAATSGMVLQHQGRLVDAYYSANCGGQTAAAVEIWPDDPHEPRPSIRDDYCQGGPHAAWRFRVTRTELWPALHADARTDPGGFLRQVRVVSHGASGRVTRIAVEGERRRVVDGWRFRQVMDRAFGWASIKSTLFKVTRRGEDFLFEGRGLGHGVGLCQAGAEAMARQGWNAPAILRYYYPEARIVSLKIVRRPVPEEKSADQNPGAASRIPVLWQKTEWRARSSEHFLVKFVGPAEANQIESLLERLESIRASYEKRTGRAPDHAVEIIVHPTTAAFTQATGKPWWVAAVTGPAIEMQPVRTLSARGVLLATLRHEYAHVLIQAASRRTPPLWLAEGFAIHLAGEGERLGRPAGPAAAAIPDQELEAMLKNPADKEQMHAAYYQAYQKVKQIIAREREAGVWRLLSQLGS